MKIPTLKLSQLLASQINYSHNKIGNKEWSGTLIYKFENPDHSINSLYDTENEEDIIILADRFLLRDIGSPGLTEFELSTQEVMEQMEYISNGYRAGLIHTHHNMKTFFSGTDQIELQTNTPNHELYLSLIVNYLDGGKPIARICWVGEQEVTLNHKYNGMNLNFTKNIFKDKTQKVIFFVDLNVEYDVDEAIALKYEELSKPKQVTTYDWSKWKPASNQLDLSFDGLEDGYNNLSYKEEKEKILAKWEQNNFKSDMDFDHNNISTFLTCWVTGNTKDARHFWQVNNSLKNITETKLEQISDYMSNKFEELVQEYFDTIPSNEEIIVLCYSILTSIDHMRGPIVDTITDLIVDILFVEMDSIQLGTLEEEDQDDFELIEIVDKTFK